MSRFALPDLLELARTNLSETAAACQERSKRRENSARQARYEQDAVATEIYYAIKKVGKMREDFEEAYEQVFNREPKPGALLREAILFIQGPGREASAGTDAMALCDAVERRCIPAVDIPAFITKNGGLEKLLKAERARKSGLIPMRLDSERFQRLEDMAFEDSIFAKIKKTKQSTSEYVIVALRKHWRTR